MSRTSRTGRFLPASTLAVLMLLMSATLLSAAEVPELNSKHDLAREILKATETNGGLVVHLGCGDAHLTAALRAGESYVVHGLDTDAAEVDKARRYLHSRNIHGPVSVDTFDGRHLPYVDNLVNLVVAVRPHDVPIDELMRVLRPGGVAYVKRNDKWNKTVKRWPGEIDQWTHFLHDPSGNAVSADRRVAPPRHLQWDAGPRWSRSHETDMSLTALVSAAGRIFHTIDEGPVGIHETPLARRRFPDRCSLVARDAFNGLVLWKRSMPDWGSAAWDDSRWRWGKGDRLWSAPLTLPRRLVAAGDRLYATLSFRAPVSELDAVTGKTLRRFDQTADAEEILLSQGMLVVRVRTDQPGDSIAAVDVESGNVVWKKHVGRIADLTLAVAGRRVCFLGAEGPVALDLSTGQQLWKVADPRPSKRASKRPPKRPTNAGTLVIHDDVVLCAAAGSVRAYSAGDGKLLWSKKINSSFRGMPDVFVVGGLAWLGTLTTTGVDLKTGQPSRHIDAGALFTGGHHARCHRARATSEFLLWSKRGVEFLDLVSDRHMRHDWFRGTCRYGVMPANGLLYVPPDPCFCYPGVKLTGFNALAAGEKAESGKRKAESGPRLERGPAFGKVADSNSTFKIRGNWPTYRRDNARSGRSAMRVGAQLKRAWRTQLRGKISPPVVDACRLFVAGIDTHQVHRLSLADGRRLWSFTAGGPVDSPPTIHKGRVLFGCTDGTVYCLRARDGQLVWRFHAAPSRRFVVSYGRLQSAWPVHGSVLVRDDVVYFAAGRSSFLDGGLYLYGLDVASGRVLHRARLDGPWPDPSQPSNRAHEMDGAKNDILVCNGERLFLTQNVFDLQLDRIAAPKTAKHGARRTDLHLVATGGFLDDSTFDRTYWTYARCWPGQYVAFSAPKSGQILAFDESTTYGLHVFTQKFSRSPYFNPGADGYDLFADDNRNDPLLDAGNANRERGHMTRSQPAKWSVKIPVRARAMVLAGDTLFLAGPPDVVDENDPLGALEGRKGALLWAVSTTDGQRLAEYRLDVPPVFDGLIAARGKLFMTTSDGAVSCWRE